VETTQLVLTEKWLELRGVIVQALARFPEAVTALQVALQSVAGLDARF
jgi:hypothetical protein